jgi:hypothetical protein
MPKYLLIPHYNKSLMETQTWHRTLDNGKEVTLKVFTTYRCFKIEIELTDAEKAEILKMDTIQLDNYSFVPDEMEGCDVDWEIVGKEEFGKEEFGKEEREKIIEDLDIDFLDEDWTCSDDTSFELLCGCDLEDPMA